MGGGVQWKQPPGQLLTLVTPRGSLEINVETICNASRVISEMLDPPRTELKINISSEGFGVLAHWLECGELGELCTKADTTAGLKRLCKAYMTGQMLEIESRFLDKVLDCIIDCVTETDNLTISDIECIAKYLMRTFAEETGGRRFLRAWLILGSMERAEHEVEFASKIARLIQRASGDVCSLAYYKSLREYIDMTERELPWVLSHCYYHLHRPEDPCSQTSSMDWGGSVSSEDSEMSEVDELNAFGEMIEGTEDSEESEDSEGSVLSFR
ncbi:hypothetical protein LTR17_005078 [Elasticomyces elasticus]|nr:hypothetical protein LTR17_005078 [Elasticomyces elasticus]